MATYSFDSGGETYSFDSPADLTDAQVTALAPSVISQYRTQAAAKAKAHEGKTGFFNALTSGAKEFGGSTLEGLGSILGSKGMQDTGADWNKTAQSEYEPTTSEDVAKAKGFFPTAGALLSKYVTEPIGGIAGRYGAPMLAGVAATAALPEAAGLGALGAAARYAPAAARALGFMGADVGAETGENLARRKEFSPNEAPSVTSAAVAGLAQSLIGAVGIPGTGAVVQGVRKMLGAPAEKLAAQVLSGEMKLPAAVAQLNSTARNFLVESATGTVSGAGMMLGTEALRRGQAGESLAEPGWVSNSLIGAAELGPLMAAFHAPGMRKAQEKGLAATEAKGTEQRQQINQELMQDAREGFTDNENADLTNRYTKQRAAELENYLEGAKAVKVEDIADPAERQAYEDQVDKWKTELHDIQMGGEEMTPEEAQIAGHADAAAILSGDPAQIIKAALARVAATKKAQDESIAVQQAEAKKVEDEKQATAATLSTPAGLASARAKLAQMEQELAVAKAIDTNRITDPADRADWVADLQRQRADTAALKKVLPASPPKAKPGEPAAVEVPPTLLKGTPDEIRARAIQEAQEREAAQKKQTADAQAKAAADSAELDKQKMAATEAKKQAKADAAAKAQADKDAATQVAAKAKADKEAQAAADKAAKTAQAEKDKADKAAKAEAAAAAEIAVRPVEQLVRSGRTHTNGVKSEKAQASLAELERRGLDADGKPKVTEEVKPAEEVAASKPPEEVKPAEEVAASKPPEEPVHVEHARKVVDSIDQGNKVSPDQIKAVAETLNIETPKNEPIAETVKKVRKAVKKAPKEEPSVVEAPQAVEAKPEEAPTPPKPPTAPESSPEAIRAHVDRLHAEHEHHKGSVPFTDLADSPPLHYDDGVKTYRKKTERPTAAASDAVDAITKKIDEYASFIACLTGG